MIPKKYTKYIIWIIVFLLTIGAITVDQKDTLIKVIDSFTSTWVTE